MIKLNVWEGKSEQTSDYIKEMVSDEPKMKGYYDRIAKELGCKVCELAMLSVLPENEKIDDEGWDIELFFPKGIKIEHKTFLTEEERDKYACGWSEKITVDGIDFIADQDASPWGIYVNFAKGHKFDIF